MLTIISVPDGKTQEVPYHKTVLSLLNHLKLRQESALVIREGQLLTPDRPLAQNDVIHILPVGSRG